MVQLKLTKQQSELWYAYKLNPKADNYNIAVSYRVKGNLDKEKFKLIYLKIGYYFEAFRTQFVEKDGETFQIIRDHFDGELIYQVLSDATEQKSLDTIEALRAKPFNLEKDWLFRAILIKTDDQTYYFQFVWHHIISDGLTTTVFSEAFEKLYNDGLEAINQFKTYSLTDYLHYEASIIADKKKETIDYWRKYLQDCHQNDIVKYLYDGQEQVKKKRLDIDPKVLRKFIKANKTTPFIFFNALISVFFFRCFNLADIVLSYPKNIRPNQMPKIIGYFVSMFPMRVKLSADITFSGLLHDIKKQYKRDRYYQEIAFEEIKKSLDFDFHPNIAVGEACIISNNIQINGLKATSLNIFYASIIDKLYFAYDTNHRVYEMIYNSKYIPDYFIKYLVTLLNEVITTNDKKISEFEFISSAQKQQLLYDWNKTEKPYPEDKIIQHLFEEQVAKTPHNIAVVFENKYLTYAQLNTKSNQLARYLQANSNIEPDTLVALCLDKSLALIIALFGILKSGAAFVAIDPDYPDDRIKYILEDTKAVFLLTQLKYFSRLQSISKSKIAVVDDNSYKNFSAHNFRSKTAENNLAYVIYTSGTTGQPKGVMIENKGIVNIIFFLKNLYELTDKHRLTHFCSISFDVSYAEIFVPLCQGASLYIFSNEIRKDPVKMYDYINTHKITHIYLPPVILSQFPRKKSNYLKVISYAGEPCNAKVASYWSDKVKLFNLYGPTEGCIYAVYKRIYSDEVEQIGKPVANVQNYVLDDKLNPLPVGVTGELYIGGKGLARGYLNQPNLTTKKFIKNLFENKIDKENGNAFFYKTGDLVRWLPDGNLEYIGRKDTQVKIHGFRIELTEIENTLSRIAGIIQTVVIAKEKNNDKYLVAYYVSEHNIKQEIIINELKNKLPSYMIPVQLLRLDKIPLTINCKVDIKKLPDIQFKSNKSYIAPVTEKERLICHAFEQVLQQHKKVGVNDDFFTLGGNSIKAIQLSLILQANFDISVSEIFEMRTAKEMAKNKNITHNLILGKLEQLKASYHKHEFNVLNNYDRKHIKTYWSKINNIKHAPFTLKPIKNVLLTGARGYLGCNLLNQLLKLTSYNIFVLIRAHTVEEAKDSLVRKFQFYFKGDLQKYIARIHIIPCNLEKSNLGLCNDGYQDLIKKVDSIIHCAALTKHYGSEDAFYSANVEATKNLLNFCSLTDLKDFHYISTCSVFEGINNEKGQHVFTEYDNPSDLESCSIIYNKTKYLGEIETINFRQKGVQSSIYRVSNLAFMQENCQLQENIEDNAFFNNLRFLIRLGYVPEEMDKIQISPTDLTAEAIIKLFDKKELSNEIHHVFNPNTIYLSNFLESKVRKVTKLGFAKFIDKLINYLHHNSDCELVTRYLLRMGWQNEKSNSNFFDSLSASVFQNKTTVLLNQLDFRWPKINMLNLKKYIAKVAD